MAIIFELLITGLERIDPNSIIVRQAKLMLNRTNRGSSYKSNALATAEHAKRDAEQTIRSATAAVEELKHGEGVK
jgi:hypothetical protein